MNVNDPLRYIKADYRYKGNSYLKEIEDVLSVLPTEDANQIGGLLTDFFDELYDEAHFEGYSDGVSDGYSDGHYDGYQEGADLRESDD